MQKLGITALQEAVALRGMRPHVRRVVVYRVKEMTVVLTQLTQAVAVEAVQAQLDKIVVLVLAEMAVQALAVQLRAAR